MSQTDGIESAETLARAEIPDLPENRDRLMQTSVSQPSLVALPNHQEQAAKLLEFATIQEALRNSEQRYRSLVEAPSEIIWDTSAAGEFVREQPSWAKFTGQT